MLKIIFIDGKYEVSGEDYEKYLEQEKQARKQKENQKNEEIEKAKKEVQTAKEEVKEANRKLEILKQANQRHAKRTASYIKKIQDMWANRKEERAGLIPKVVYDEKINMCKTNKELIDYVSKKRDFKFSGFSRSDLEKTKEILLGIDSVMNTFEKIKIGKLVKTKVNCLMCAQAYFDKAPDISVNNKAFTCSYRDNSFHPKNFSAKTSAIHEMGHVVNYYLAKLENNNVITYEKIAKEIIIEASKNIKDISFQKKDLTEKRETISIYADDDYKFTETIAEAFADVYGNQKDAKPLSKQIFKEIKRRVKIAEAKYR